MKDVCVGERVKEMVVWYGIGIEIENVYLRVGV